MEEVRAPPSALREGQVIAAARTHRNSARWPVAPTVGLRQFRARQSLDFYGMGNRAEQTSRPAGHGMSGW